MAAPQYGAADILAALQRLLPRGRVWPRAASAVMTQALATLAPSFVRSAAAGTSLISEALPSSTVQLLPEWQATLGLPDPCAGANPSTDQARQQVVARFTDGGGQSVAYLVQFATQLGYQVRIRQFAPFRTGQSRCGQRLGGKDWWYAWQVVAPATTVTRFKCGSSRCGDPLASWSNAVLQCELQAVAPAHTTLLFSYFTPGSLYLDHSSCSALVPTCF